MTRTLSLFDEGRPDPCPADFNMAGYVLAHAERHAEKPALVVVDGAGRVLERWNYGEIDRAVRGTAAGLARAGLSRGDRLALRVGSSSDFPFLFFGAILIGAVPVPTSTQLTPYEFERLSEDMEPRLVALEPGLADGLASRSGTLSPSDWRAWRTLPPAEPAPTRGVEPAFLIYTSGTSGKPKGVLHAHRSAWARRMMWTGWYGLGESDIMLHAGAFNWTYTLGTGLTDPWAAGATTVISVGTGSPGRWAAIARIHRPTIFAAVPGVYRQLLRAGAEEGRDLAADFAALRHGLTAGERLEEPLAAAWDEAAGKPLYEALGMSEISTFLSSGPAVARRPGRAGRPQKGRRVAVVDTGGTPVPVSVEGTLAVSRGDPGLMLGYWRDAAATEAAMSGEWFLTGDRATMDADGYVAHLGRADDMMTSLGYRVSPAEVEAAIAAHAGVREVAVAELPVRADLALIAAFVVPAKGMPHKTDLEAHVATRLAAYKRPKVWIEVSDLPRTPNGKLLRNALVAAHRRDEC